MPSAVRGQPSLGLSRHLSIKVISPSKNPYDTPSVLARGSGGAPLASLISPRKPARIQQHGIRRGARKMGLLTDARVSPSENNRGTCANGNVR